MITDVKLAIILIAALGMAVFGYGFLVGGALDSGLIHTAIAAISGLSGYELGKNVVK